jgi:hypothetical protein
MIFESILKEMLIPLFKMMVGLFGVNGKVPIELLLETPCIKEMNVYIF